MRVICKFFYDGKPVDWVDGNITGFMETYGWKWYGQGYDLEFDKRDIAFDREFPDIKEDAVEISVIATRTDVKDK